MITDFIKYLADRKDTIAIHEVGSGLFLSHKLCCTDGASKILESTHCYYGWNPGDKRAVSIAHNDEILDVLTEKHSNAKFKISFTSQSGKSKWAHGFLTVKGLGIRWSYHLTFGYGIAKSEVGRMFANWFLHNYKNILYSVSELKGMGLVDGAFDSEGKFCPALMPNSDCAPFILLKGDWKRPQEVLRCCTDIAMYKGSFNPKHAGHESIESKMTKNHKVSIVEMCSETFDGKKTSIQALIGRAKQFEGLVMISKNARYDVMTEYIRSIQSPCGITYYMGNDVYEKIDKSWIAENPVLKFEVFIRKTRNAQVRFHEHEFPEIFSTQIREGKLS